jgi:hypothetical protein
VQAPKQDASESNEVAARRAGRKPTTGTHRSVLGRRIFQGQFDVKFSDSEAEGCIKDVSRWSEGARCPNEGIFAGLSN